MLEIMGKDPTLPYIYQRPWLGWGYVAFWSTTNPAAMVIVEELHWFAPQAHNGLLEMLLHVGLFGTAFFVFLWARTFWLSLRCMYTPEKALAITSLLSCVGIILVGTSETVLIVPFEASTSVFFITGLFCERAVRAARRPRYPAARWDVSRSVPVRT